MEVPPKSAAFKISLGFFLFWLGFHFVIADFPPPVGFLWVIFLNSIAAYLVFIRAPTYRTWLGNRHKGRWLRVALDGFSVGVIFAVALMLIPGNGEPTIPPPGFTEHLIWLAALGMYGTVNAGLVYSVVHLSERCRLKQILNERGKKRRVV